MLSTIISRTLPLRLQKRKRVKSLRARNLTRIKSILPHTHGPPEPLRPVVIKAANLESRYWKTIKYKRGFAGLSVRLRTGPKLKERRCPVSYYGLQLDRPVAGRLSLRLSEVEHCFSLESVACSLYAYQLIAMQVFKGRQCPSKRRPPEGFSAPARPAQQRNKDISDGRPAVIFPAILPPVALHALLQ